MKIGFFQTGTQILDYFAAQLDVFLLGKFLGMEVLGIYSLSKELLVKIFFVINGIANKLMKQSCAVLKTSKPTLTVADTNLPQLQKLLDKNGFTFSYKKKGAYLQNDTENYFNNEATEILKKNILEPLFAKKLRQK